MIKLDYAEYDSCSPDDKKNTYREWLINAQLWVRTK